MKSEEKQKARELRLQGISIKSIAKTLCVSPASVSQWTKDIIISDEQAEKFYKNQLKGAQIKSQLARKLRLSFREIGKIQAQKCDSLHMQACMLYWAEGRKHKSRCQFVNSDPHMIKLFVNFLKTKLNVESSKILLNINCYINNDLSIKDIEDYWLNLTNLEHSSLRKSQINKLPKSSKNLKQNKLIYGVCNITVNDVKIAQHIFGAIQEYAKIPENIFLD